MEKIKEALDLLKASMLYNENIYQKIDKTCKEEHEKILFDAQKQLQQSHDRERVLSEALEQLTDTIDDQFGISEGQLEVIYISEFGIEIDQRLEPWCSLFDSHFKALKALEASK